MHILNLGVQTWVHMIELVKPMELFYRTGRRLLAGRATAMAPGRCQMWRLMGGREMKLASSSRARHRQRAGSSCEEERDDAGVLLVYTAGVELWMAVPVAAAAAAHARNGRANRRRSTHL